MVNHTCLKQRSLQTKNIFNPHIFIAFYFTSVNLPLTFECLSRLKVSQSINPCLLSKLVTCCFQSRKMLLFIKTKPAEIWINIVISVVVLKFWIMEISEFDRNLHQWGQKYKGIMNFWD